MVIAWFRFLSFRVLEHLVVVLFVLVHGHSGVIVETLGHELKGQRVLLSRGLFNLCSLVLEPNFDLILV